MGNRARPRPECGAPVGDRTMRKWASPRPASEGGGAGPCGSLRAPTRAPCDGNAGRRPTPTGNSRRAACPPVSALPPPMAPPRAPAARALDRPAPHCPKQGNTCRGTTQRTDYRNLQPRRPAATHKRQVLCAAGNGTGWRRQGHCDQSHGGDGAGRNGGAVPGSRAVQESRRTGSLCQGGTSRKEEKAADGLPSGDERNAEEGGGEKGIH